MRKAAATEDDDLALEGIHEKIKANITEIESLKVKISQREEETQRKLSREKYTDKLYQK